jgi:hypothetical protein
MPRLLLLVPIALAWTGAAAAEPAPLDLSRLRDAGLARTAVERPIGKRSSAAFGFLCGRQPDPVTSGGAAAYGVDPHGRFVGAQVKLRFR